jgi:hypothetical protein
MSEMIEMPVDEQQWFEQKPCGTWVRVTPHQAADAHHDGRQVALMTFNDAVKRNARCSGDDDGVL